MKLDEKDLEEFKILMKDWTLKQLGEKFGISTSVASRIRKRLRAGKTGYDSELMRVTAAKKRAEDLGYIEYEGCICEKCGTNKKYVANNTCVKCQRARGNSSLNPRKKHVKLKVYKAKIEEKVKKEVEIIAIEKKAVQSIEDYDESNRKRAKARLDVEDLLASRKDELDEMLGY